MYTQLDEQLEQAEDVDTYQPDEYEEYKDECIKELNYEKYRTNKLLRI